jgi:hypothetical protein
MSAGDRDRAFEALLELLKRSRGFDFTALGRATRPTSATGL